MGAFVLRKFGYACLSLFLVATLTFALMKAIPGDPFQQEQALPEAIYQALRTHYGLDAPISSQYVRYITQLARFDFGPSLVHQGRDVTAIIRDSFPTSALLGAAALAIAIPTGILLGIAAAACRGRWEDAFVQVAAVAGISVPSFILATLLQYVVAIKWGLLPIARWGSLGQIVLPALSLAALPAAFIARLTRARMGEELVQGYVSTARAKGLLEPAVIFRHVLRNAILPVLSYLGPLTASVMTGSFIVEKIYGIPGLGYWFVMSVANRDYPLIMGITVFYCALLLLCTFLVDIALVTVDPRVARTAMLKRGK